MYNCFKITFLKDCEVKILDFDYYRPWRSYINFKRKFSRGQFLITTPSLLTEIMGSLTKNGNITFSIDDSHVDRFETSERVSFSEAKAPMAKLKIEEIAREDVGVRPNDGKF